MRRFRKLKMQMKKLLKNNGIECRKAPQTERFAELFYFLLMGSVNLNVEPLPTSDVTVILPPS